MEEYQSEDYLFLCNWFFKEAHRLSLYKTMTNRLILIIARTYVELKVSVGWWSLPLCVFLSSLAIIFPTYVVFHCLKAITTKYFLPNSAVWENT